MPSITQLEYILAVEKHRHFGKAAESCHISQPTLSMQIQKVEEEVGFALFDRLKKPVVPTPKGNHFVQQARVLLHEYRKLVDLSRRQGNEVSGELKLGVIPTVAPYLLPLFVEPFSKRYPNVHLKIDELKTRDVLEMLSEDRLDAALLATPLGETGLHERPLYYEPFYLYVAPSHPLNARKRIREEDLSGEDMWILADGHCFRNQVARYCTLAAEGGVFPNVHFEGGNIDTLRYLIRTSRGYTLIPALCVETLTATERETFVREFERPIPTREISLIYRRDQWKSDILNALEGVIRAHVPAHLKKLDSKRQTVLDVQS
ncbi:MAG: LysR substrate-binding domain-containing protein [Bdellovibrionales bacterium]